jgi:hypothetical protein
MIIEPYTITNKDVNDKIFVEYYDSKHIAEQVEVARKNNELYDRNNDDKQLKMGNN